MENKAKHIIIRIEEEKKKQFEDLCSESGAVASKVIRMWIDQMIETRNIKAPEVTK